MIITSCVSHVMESKIMDYQLARSLKDAGFPQESDEQYCDYCKSGIWDMKIDQNGCDCWKEIKKYDYSLKTCIPTLFELIEACGESKGDYQQFGLLFTGKFWECGYKDNVYLPVKGNQFFEPHSNGTTPEEAVAKLWLALYPIKEIHEFLPDENGNIEINKAIIRGKLIEQKPEN